MAFKDGTVANENLPFPIVCYPGHYGAFIGFAKDLDVNIHMCECARKAIVNYIISRLAGMISEYANPEKNFLLSSNDFPLHLVKHLKAKFSNPDESLLSAIKFAPGLCHKCNQTTPELRYCVPMYGGVFKQKFGWYIKQRNIEYGIDVVGTEVRSGPRKLDSGK